MARSHQPDDIELVKADHQASLPETAQFEPGKYRYVVLFVLAIIYCLNYMDRQILGILSLPIKAELDLSDMQLGLMGGLAFAIFYSALGIPIARVADRVNRVRVIALAVGLWSVFTALCGLAGSFTQLFLARLGVGIGEAGGVAPTYSVLADYFAPRERARAMAVLTLGLPVGSALGLFVGGAIAASYGWRAAFFVLGVGGLFMVPIALLSVREPRRGRLDPVTSASTEASLGEVVRHVAGKPSFWLFSLGAATASMLSYGLGFWLPSFVHRSQNLSLTETSRYLALITFVGGVAGTLLGGWLSDRLGAHRKAAYGWVPGTAFVIGLPFLLAAVTVTTPFMLFALLIVPQAMGLVWTGPTIAAIQQLAPARMRSTAAAIFLFICNFIGLGIGTVSFGALSDTLHGQFGDDALRYSIMICGLILYPLTALLYFGAGKRLAKDWEQVA
ncbi:spinster family MFS transporter [Novosphingobium silvae]|nr:MFS transporter [Novosphingobium silvae]